MSGQTEEAIKVLQDGLKPDRPVLFQQADALVSETCKIIWRYH